MSDADPRDEIARLEAEIEERSEALERCRKIILISKFTVAGGVLVLLLMLTGIVRLDAAAMIGAFAAVIGGVVMFGSTTTTSGQWSAAIKDAEARRADLIGQIDPRVVGDEMSAH
jgi:transposase